VQSVPCGQFIDAAASESPVFKKITDCAESERAVTMQSIFDNVERSETRPQYFSESSFAYYNATARPGFAAIREFIERWYSEFPDSAKTDIFGRMRSGKDTDFLSAFFELYLSQLCKRSGFELAAYPGMEAHSRKKHPDFLVLRDGKPAFFVEGTLAQEPQSTRAAKRRLAQLEDAINHLHCPDFWLWLDISGVADGNIPVGKIKKRMQKWLDTLNADGVTEEVRAKGEEGFPKCSENCGRLAFTITARPKGHDIRDKPNVRPLAAVLPDVLFECDAHDDVRQAVVRKAGYYGDLELPYILAIDVINEFLDFDDILDGLFGRRTVQVWRGPQGVTSRQLTRAANGAWTAGRRASNTLVSAVLVANNLIPTTLAVETPLLVHNPWAKNPLPRDIWRLPQKSVDLISTKLIDHAGVEAREILGVPERWPILD
jgi:hypothetical protein